MTRKKSKTENKKIVKKSKSKSEKKKPEAGDKVKVKLAKETIEGVLLDSYESGIYLIKLKSGYNIGLTKQEVLDIELVEKQKTEDKKEIEIKRDREKKNVGLIITGGTIASKLDPKTGGVKWITDRNEFLRFYSELLDYCNIVEIETPFMMASEDMSYKEWIKIAKTAQKMLNDDNIDGIIITHGTDFLHYTSSALSFMLRNLNKPVVLTYSQRSIDRASSDARLNLICSAKAAVSDIAEVMLVGHGSINDDYCLAIRGTKVRKLHSSRRDAFKPVNDNAIAKIWKDKLEILGKYRKRNNRKVELDDSFAKVGLIKFYPGQNPDILDYYVKNKYKGLIIEMGGLGHVAVDSKNSWISKLKKAIKSGLIICGVAQTIFGRLDPYVYSNGRKLQETGVIYLKDMLAETAFVKLGWVLGHKNVKTKEKIREMMLKNFAGEINNRIGKEFI